MCMHLHFDCIGIQTDINLLKEQMLPSEDTIAAGEISGTKWNEAPNTMNLPILPYISVPFSRSASFYVLLKMSFPCSPVSMASRALGFISSSLNHWPNWGWNCLASFPNSPGKMFIGLFCFRFHLWFKQFF